MIPVVVGEVTNTAAVSGSPSAIYNGPAYGSFRTNSGNRIQNSVGSMTANADLANRNINSVALSFNDLFGFGNNIAISGGTMPIDPSSTGKAVFSTTTATVSGYATGTAQINGALFGPSGEEIGGNFRVTSGTLAQSSGVYLGKQ